MENCQKGVFLFEAEMGQPPRPLCGEQSVKTTLVVPLFRSLLKSATIVREKNAWSQMCDLGQTKSVS